MKNFISSFANHLVGENTNLATFWRIIRLDNLVQGFTNHDKDINIDGIIYKANTGFNSTAFNQDNTLAVRNLEMESIISSTSISEADLIGGKYDYARVDVFICRWDSPPSSLSLNPPGHILMVRGIIGQISMSDRRYNAEIRSFSQILQQQISTITTKECRAVFGDSKCTKNLSSLTDQLTITGITSNRQFVVNSSRATGFYDLGQITFNSGNNNGVKTMILSYSNGTIQLFEPVPYPLTIGDTLTAIAGCNKSIEACKNFNNIINYQGEPHIPGEDKFLAGFDG